MPRDLPNKDKSILRPDDFVGYLLGEKLAMFKGFQSALICFDPDCYKYLKRLNKGKIVKSLTGEVVLLENNILLGGLMGIGSPASVAFTEELIGCGLVRFIFLGTAGRIHAGLEAFEVVTCKSAFSEEGTSKCFPGWKDVSTPSESLLIELEVFFQNNDIFPKRVNTWTTDAPYMETAEKLKHYLAKGVDVVEMEASAIFNLANYRKVDIAMVFAISDSLAEGIWVPYFKQKTLQNTLHKTGKMLIDFLEKADSSG